MTVEAADQGGFDEATDVVVVGLGAAGTVAAIEAVEHGARVIGLDRWGRGGASARSGGVLYAGGGTRQQVAAGFEDDPAQMERYLSLEEGLPADDARLEHFCERSLADVAWLEGHGVAFPMGFDPSKAVVPVSDDTGLYFSGNEQHYASDRPVARGHRVAGEGMTGHSLMAALSAAAVEAGVSVRPRARLRRLLVDEEGRVTGVEAVVLGDDTGTRLLDALLYRLVDVSGPVLRRVPVLLEAALRRFEERRGRCLRIRAREGVILATGGFSFNRRLMRRWAPAFERAMPLGTPGDDGSGILAARTVGAAVRLTEHCGASRFIAPPVAFCRGILVDAAGRRICDESLYAATLSAHIAERGGRAWLVVDAGTRRAARRQIREAAPIRSRPLGQLVRGWASHVVFPRLFGSINLYLNRVTAPTLGALAARIGVPADALEATVADYNDAAARGGPDPMGKAAHDLAAITEPPFAAVPCHLASVIFPAPCITLGGIDVDGEQRVRRDDGSAVEGLYAVGRCAAGVASRSYVSGLSLADCVFSGRNAGLSVSARCETSLPRPA